MGRLWRTAFREEETTSGPSGSSSFRSKRAECSCPAVLLLLPDSVFSPMTTNRRRRRLVPGSRPMPRRVVCLDCTPPIGQMALSIFPFQTIPPPPLVLVPLSPPPPPPLELAGALARFILNLTARPFRYSMMGWSRPLLLLLMLPFPLPPPPPPPI
ncbi:hypothetical protein TYRP_004155 [Tyrophagus putrescentiae]|nr:hypothetical protein TYRP_004155 [Tyrophagus putrescentiae]